MRYVWWWDGEAVTHDCEATRSALVDLLFGDSPSLGRTSALLAIATVTMTIPNTGTPSNTTRRLKPAIAAMASRTPLNQTRHAYVEDEMQPDIGMGGTGSLGCWFH